MLFSPFSPSCVPSLLTSPIYIFAISSHLTLAFEYSYHVWDFTSLSESSDLRRGFNRCKKNTTWIAMTREVPTWVFSLPSHTWTEGAGREWSSRRNWGGLTEEQRDEEYWAVPIFRGRESQVLDMRTRESAFRTRCWHVLSELAVDWLTWGGSEIYLYEIG